MNDASIGGRPPGIERFGYMTLVALILAPLIAQGLWRPLLHLFGPGGDALWVTVLAELTALAVVLVRVSGKGTSPWSGFVAGAGVAVGGAILLALGLAGGVTLLAVAAAVSGLLPALASRLPERFDGLARRHPWLTALYCVAALFTVLSVGRVSTYMGDPARVALQALPGDAFVETHSCLTAYVRASELAHRGVENLYADHWWSGSLGLPPLPPGEENPYAPFHQDNFSYPPPFLLLMMPFDLLQGDFLAQRALWFGLSGLILALGFWSVAQWIEGPGRHRSLLLAPLFLGCLPILITLQIGNFHPLTVVLSVLAMIAFERGRPAVGGAVLAMTILSKVSPGILGIFLLAQRRYRDAAYTAGFGVLLLAASILQHGVEPVWSFFTFALPRLSSGEAFPFMGTENGILTNMSPFGIAFKLPVFGIEVSEPWRLGGQLARVFTVLLVVLAIASARRQGNRLQQGITWMCLLVLAALQSPFAPGYGALGLLWATTLLASEVKGWRGVCGIVLLWFLALVVPPNLTLAQGAAHGLLQMTVVIVAAVWMMFRRRSEEASPRQEPAG